MPPISSAWSSPSFQSTRYGQRSSRAAELKRQSGKKDMTAFVIGHVTVKDSEKWAEYRSRVPGTLAPWGAELVLRGKRMAVLSGHHNHTDTVVIRFPNAESVANWYNSAAYRELLPLRTQAAIIDLISYESAP